MSMGPHHADGQTLIAGSIQIVVFRYPPPFRIQKTTCPIRMFFHGGGT